MGSAGFEPTSSGIFVFQKNTQTTESKPGQPNSPYQTEKSDTNPTACESEPYGLKGLFGLYVEICVMSAPYVGFVI